MQAANGEGQALTPGEGWEAIYETMERGRSSMYLAGTTTILLLWGVIVSLGYFSQYAIETFAPGFAAERPWFPGPVWGVLAAAGITGSAIIGSRASSGIAAGAAARSAGIRVFLYWLAVVLAAFCITAGSGMWNGGSGEQIQGVVVGIVALGFVLFGIMHQPMLAAVGVGIAAAYYLPHHFAGDGALAVSASSMLAVALLGAAWARKSGVR
ncbi:MAG: hypothetical protein OXL97_09205 [Chloroflexota bacterium]|nr:hypothetical protein [Chloroflexota bacterium]MDE2885006.1 hypothetical protein [Chloroflexota bacterium]